MNARNVQFQQQLQEKDDEINRLRRELDALREIDLKVHIVSTGIRQPIRVHKSAEMKLHTCTGKFTSDLASSMIWLHVQLYTTLL